MEIYYVFITHWIFDALEFIFLYDNNGIKKNKYSNYIMIFIKNDYIKLYEKYINSKTKYLELQNKYIMKGGGYNDNKSLIIHVAGSGKTTLGNQLLDIYRNEIHVKDLDELHKDFNKQKIISKYQEYIDNLINEHNDKPLILIGLDPDLCLGPRYDIYKFKNTEYKYYIDIDIDTDTTVKQWFFKQINKLHSRKEWVFNEWLKNNDKIQQKLIELIDIDGMVEKKKKCDSVYKSRGYKFMTPKSIMQKCTELLGAYGISNGISNDNMSYEIVRSLGR